VRICRLVSSADDQPWGLQVKKINYAHIFLLSVLALLSTPKLLAQNIAPLAAPNLDLYRSGEAIVRLADGTQILAGSFTSWAVYRARPSELVPTANLQSKSIPLRS
jgi:hypothetical protein